MKAYIDEQILRQYFFDTNYFQLQQGLEIRGFLFQKKTVQRKTALLEAYTYVVKWFFFSKNRVASRLLSKIRVLQVLLWTNSCAQETGLNGQYITLFVVEWDMITQWVEIISSIFLKRFFYFLHFHEILF